jgi:hypothetical protein
MPPSLSGSFFQGTSGCPEGNLQEARRDVQSAIVELQVQRVQAEIEGNAEWLAEIDSQLAQYEAQLAAWEDCPDDHLDRARGSH